MTNEQPISPRLTALHAARQAFLEQLASTPEQTQNRVARRVYALTIDTRGEIRGNNETAYFASILAAHDLLIECELYNLRNVSPT